MNAEAPQRRPRGRPPGARRAKSALAGDVNKLGQAMGRKGQETRRRLLEATRALLETTRIRDLQVANIARSANTSPATFYVYFNDVQAAVLALIGEVTQSTPNLLALLAGRWAEIGDYAYAHAFVSGYIEHWRSHAPLFRVRNLASDEGDRRFTELRLHAVRALLGAMAERIEARQKTDRLPADLVPLALAGALLALIERIAVIKVAASPYGVTEDSLVEAATFFVILAMGETEVMSAIPIGPATPAPVSRRAQGRYDPQPLAAAPTNLQGQVLGPKGAATRERIIEATNELIRGRGLREFSVKDIADLAGVSTSAFYLYFEDATDAVLQLIRRESKMPSRLAEILAQDLKPQVAAAAAREFVDLYVDNWQRHGPLFRVRNHAGDEGDERFVAVRRDATADLMVILHRHITACADRRKLPAGLHPYSLSGAFIAMLERLCATPTVGVDGPTTRQTLNRAAAYFLEVLLAGVDAPA